MDCEESTRNSWGFRLSFCLQNTVRIHIFISNHIYTLVKLTHQTRFGPNWAIFSDTLIWSEVPHWFTFKIRYNFFWNHLTVCKQLKKMVLYKYFYLYKLFTDSKVVFKCFKYCHVNQWGTYDLISVSLKMAQLGPKRVWCVNLTSV
jgi:hypothetical protein